MSNAVVQPSQGDLPCIIVGAGLAGSLLACILARRGMTVNVFERRPDPRARGFIGGRSINLALSARGLEALDLIDLSRQILDDAIPMPGRMMHDESGTLTYQAYSQDPNEAINSVSRGALNLALLEAADQHDNVSLHFECRCLDIDVEETAVKLLQADTERRFTVRGSVVLGTDGAFSAVRSRLQKTNRFSYAQQFIDHGYKELTIPPKADGSFAMEPNALHIWPRGGFMMIALPNTDASFTCTCFWPFRGPASFQAVQSDAEVSAFFERHFADAVPLMPTLLEDFQANPVGSLVTIRCNPWHAGRTAVLGDAAHAIVPFFGQGMNAAFQDCTLLNQLLDRYQEDWDRVLPALSAEQQPHAEAIADMALYNFIEMRDHVASRWFLLKKRGQHLLHGLFPRFFVPLYNMVSFTTIPYATAKARSRRQSQVIRGILIGLVSLLVLLVLIVLGRL